MSEAKLFSPLKVGAVTVPNPRIYGAVDASAQH